MGPAGLAPNKGRELFLGCLGAIYTIAFLSYWQQYDGLLGIDGLQPVNIFLSQTRSRIDPSLAKTPFELWLSSPMLSWFASPVFGIPIDSFHDIISLLGALSSMLAAFGICQHGCLFAVQWIIYLTLYKSGQTFYSFQWDILLLEVGFASIFYANWVVSFPCETVCSMLNRGKGGVIAEKSTSQDVVYQFAGSGIWPIRFIFFKLMLMSGVVKVQSLCPTWLHLTALEYHFATQCLPTPLAWFAHQTPFPLLRLGVAATLVIEIPCAFMLIAPNVNVRIAGAYLQLLLQIFIILTGNYNFFNILTMSLCIPVMTCDIYCSRDYSVPPSSQDTGEDYRRSTEGSVVKPHIVESSSRSSMNKGGYYESTVLFISTISYFTWVSVISTSIYFMYDREKGVSSNLIEFLQQDIRFGQLLFSSMVFIFFITVFHWFRVEFSQEYFTMVEKGQEGNTTQANKSQGLFQSSLWNMTTRLINILSRFLSLFFAIAILIPITVPLVSLQPTYLQSLLPQFQLVAYQQSLVYSISSGYGLFRSMTGVGDPDQHPEWSRNDVHGFDNMFYPLSSLSKGTTHSDTTLPTSNNGWGWLGGMSQVVVARPEVIIEGLWRVEKEVVVEEGRSSSLVEKEEWIEIPFLYKPGNTSASPRWVAPHQPRVDWQMWFAALGSYSHNPWLVHLMAKLLHSVPETRPLETEEGKRSIKEVGNGCPAVFALIDESVYASKGLNTPPLLIRANLYHYTLTRQTTTASEVWQREFVGEYFPPIRAQDPSLLQFLSHYGWSTSLKCERKTAVYEDALHQNQNQNQNMADDPDVKDCYELHGLKTSSQLKSRMYSSTLESCLSVTRMVAVLRQYKFSSALTWRCFGVLWFILFIAKWWKQVCLETCSGERDTRLESENQKNQSVDTSDVPNKASGDQNKSSSGLRRRKRVELEYDP